MAKNKICKGTGKAKGYGCKIELPYTENNGIKTYNAKYGLGIDCGCYRNWLTGDAPEAKEVFNKFLISNKRKVEKEQKKKEREENQKNKSIQKLIQEARIPFQKYIRKRDANKACISCGTTKSDIWDAGHFYKAELYSGLIFSEGNVHKQCRKCNTYLSGNDGEYRKGILKRYGQDFLNELDKAAIEKRNHKYTREELIEIKKHYTQKLKE